MQRFAILSVLLASTFASPTQHARGETISCGSKGYDKGHAAYSFIDRASFATVAACGAKCSAESECKAFAVGAGACLLYSLPVQSNFRADSWSPFSFYDKSCVSSSSLVPSASVPAQSGAPSPSGSQPSSPPSTTPGTGSCDVIGYDKGRPTAFYYSNKATDATLAACSSLCKKYNCKSFAFGKTECLLYSTALLGNFVAERNSPFHFYDASCVAAGSSSAVPHPSSSQPPAAASSSRPASSYGPSSSAIPPSSSRPSAAPSSSQVSSSRASSISISSNAAPSSSRSSSSSPSPSSSPSSSSSAAPPVLSSSITSTSASSSIPVASRSSSTSSSASPSPSTAYPCGVETVVLDTPNPFVAPLRAPYNNTLLGCEQACVLSSCKSIYFSGQCFLFYIPAIETNYTVFDPVALNITVPAGTLIPTLYDARCFQDSIGSPAPVSRIPPTTDPAAGPACGTGVSNFESSAATFASQGSVAQTQAFCSTLCTGLNCGSFAIDTTSAASGGCVLFDRSANATVLGKSEASTFKIYDRTCI